jgi:hypothetical protein
VRDVTLKANTISDPGAAFDIVTIGVGSPELRIIDLPGAFEPADLTAADNFRRFEIQIDRCINVRGDGSSCAKACCIDLSESQHFRFFSSCFSAVSFRLEACDDTCGVATTLAAGTSLVATFEARVLADCEWLAHPGGAASVAPHGDLYGRIILGDRKRSPTAVSEPVVQRTTLFTTHNSLHDDPDLGLRYVFGNIQTLNCVLFGYSYGLAAHEAPHYENADSKEPLMLASITKKECPLLDPSGKSHPSGHVHQTTLIRPRPSDHTHPATQIRPHPSGHAHQTIPIRPRTSDHTHPASHTPNPSSPVVKATFDGNVSDAPRKYIICLIVWCD